MRGRAKKSIKVGEFVSAVCCQCNGDISDALAEKHALEVKIAELKRSRESHQRAERLALDAYEAAREKRGGP